MLQYCEVAQPHTPCCWMSLEQLKYDATVRLCHQLLPCISVCTSRCSSLTARGYVCLSISVMFAFELSAVSASTPVYPFHLRFTCLPVCGSYTGKSEGWGICHNGDCSMV